jgi:nitrogen fixation protein NifB
VTSAVLSPGQAINYLIAAAGKIPRLSVAGIAGPGDPFADPEITLETLALVRKRFPCMLACVATNGLGLLPYVDTLAALNVSHVTITVNAVDPSVGAKIYAWVKDGKTVLRGEKGAALLCERQAAAIKELKQRGITVKVNTIILPGINDHHIEEVARTVAADGAAVMNCIPLYPAGGTIFEELLPPSPEKIAALRKRAGQYLPLMYHCARCRADAAGLLDAPLSDAAQGLLKESERLPLNPGEHRPFVAVATREGVLVNLHLGAADEVWVFGRVNDAYSLIEKRRTPAPGGGDHRWEELAGLLKDCRMLLASGAGPTPARLLEGRGLKIVITEGLIAHGLSAAFGDGDFGRSGRQWNGCGQGCGGTGEGCR